MADRGSLIQRITHWAWFDQQVIDPMDVEQLARVAAMLRVDPTEVYHAVTQVGPGAGDVRRYLQQERR